MPETPDRRPAEREYQDRMAEFDRRRLELERQGMSPCEAGFAMQALMGETATRTTQYPKQGDGHDEREQTPPARGREEEGGGRRGPEAETGGRGLDEGP